MIERDWHGCYGDSWKGEIVDEAFAHPAKFSRGLIRRIYQHALEQGWIEPGDTILDTFAGVGLGAKDAVQLGLNWVGIELEQKFVDLGRENIALWEFRNRGQRYNDNLPTPGKAILIQSDSRQLCQVLREAGAVVSSPPFTSTLGKGGETKGYHSYDEDEAYNRSKRDYLEPESLTNLANLPEGKIDAALGSPPYEGIPIIARADGDIGRQYREGKRDRGAAKGKERTYNADNLDNLGNSTGETFWTAAALIMQQTYSVLRSGAVAIWVLKAFVRDKAIVDFPSQWAALGESCGFETIEWIRAWLIEDRGTQYTLDGEMETKTIARKSFFRRLYEGKYPENSIDFEIVLVQRKAP